MVCASIPTFSPWSKVELTGVVRACLNNLVAKMAIIDCSDGPYGVTGEYVESFNGDISKWDASSVTDIHGHHVPLCDII